MDKLSLPRYGDGGGVFFRRGVNHDGEKKTGQEEGERLVVR